MALNSITHAIPLTAQTDPNKFPKGDYQPYPRMMVRKGDGKPFVDASGRNPVIVQNEDEEAEFRAAHDGEVRDNVASAADIQGELVALRAENARLKEAAGGAKEAAPKGAPVSSLVRDKDGDDVPIKPAAKAAASRTPGRKLD